MVNRTRPIGVLPIGRDATAKGKSSADARHADLGLSETEAAFYNVLEVNDNAVKVIGDEKLRTIARECPPSTARHWQAHITQVL